MDEKLVKIKKDISNAYSYFFPNIQRYNNYIDFIYNSNLTQKVRDNLKAIKRPALEINIISAFISRLCGEFSKQEPSLHVKIDRSSMDDEKAILTKNVLQQHLRFISKEYVSGNEGYDVYKNQLGGGFSAIKVVTEYRNNTSFEQDIKLKKVKDPTLVLFDPLAENKAKNDGRFYVEIFIMPEEEFKAEFGDGNMPGNKHMSSDGFEWKSKGSEKTVTVCDFYEKEVKNVKLVQLDSGEVMRLSKYNSLYRNAESPIDQDDPFLNVPQIVKTRMIRDDKVIRYRVCGNKILSKENTSYSHLNCIFVDGDSVILNFNNALRQHTRPYAYNARGLQQLINVTAQTLGQEIQMRPQSKVVISNEALGSNQTIIEDYQNQQMSSVKRYNAYDDNGRALPMPQFESPPPIPAELLQTLDVCVSMMQSVLGSYDAQLGLNKNDLSGIAIVESATQSNATAMPYIVSYLNALEEACNVILDLIPKYYKTPRTIPIINDKGEHDFVKINDPSDPKSVDFNFDPTIFSVTITPGVNFEIERMRTLKFLLSAMQEGGPLGEFISKNALPIIMKNIDIRGKDQLYEASKQFQEQQQQNQANAQEVQQKEMEMNPDFIKAQAYSKKVDSDIGLSEHALALKQQQASFQQVMDQQDANINLIKASSDIDADNNDNQIESKKLEQESLRSEVDRLKTIVEMFSDVVNSKKSMSGEIDEISKIGGGDKEENDGQKP